MAFRNNPGHGQQLLFVQNSAYSKTFFFPLLFLTLSFLTLFGQIVQAEETNSPAERTSIEKSVPTQPREKTFNLIGQDKGSVMQTPGNRLPLGALILILKQKGFIETKVPAHALIGPEGGTLVAFGSEGRAFRLTIPPQAILGPPIVITLQPLDSVQGLPISGEPLAGVRLEPDGLSFTVPVTMEVRIQQPAKKSELLTVSTRNSGEYPFFVPLILNEPEVQELSVQLNHFSTLWVGKGEASDIKNHYLPPEYIDQVTQDLAEWAAYRAAEEVTQEQYENNTSYLIESYLNIQVLSFLEYSHYTCAVIGDATERIARWAGFTNVFGYEGDRQEGLARIKEIIPLDAKESLNNDVAALAEECRQLEASCETDELIRRVALCNAQANHLSALTETDLFIDPELTGNFCPGKPAAIRISPHRYTVCTSKSFPIYGWVEDTGGDILDNSKFPITWNSTNELVMSVGPDKVVKGLRPGEVDLLATAGCSVETRLPIRVGVVNLVGQWKLSGTETVTGCVDSEDNGVYTGSGTVQIDWQYETGGGFAHVGGKLSGQVFNGTIDCSGSFNGEGFYIHEDDGWCLDQNNKYVECDVEGHDVIKGTVTSSTGYNSGEGTALSLSVTTESVDIIGDTCHSKGEGTMDRVGFAY